MGLGRPWQPKSCRFREILGSGHLKSLAEGVWKVRKAKERRTRIGETGMAAWKGSQGFIAEESLRTQDLWVKAMVQSLVPVLYI